jgi:hypothetical protein
VCVVVSSDAPPRATTSRTVFDPTSTTAAFLPTAA